MSIQTKFGSVVFHKQPFLFSPKRLFQRYYQKTRPSEYGRIVVVTSPYLIHRFGLKRHTQCPHFDLHQILYSLSLSELFVAENLTTRFNGGKSNIVVRTRCFGLVSSPNFSVTPEIVDKVQKTIRVGENSSKSQMIPFFYCSGIMKTYS